MPETLRTCPICGKERDEKFRPFCSKRCADVDLSRWLGGNYGVPAVEPPDDFGAEAEFYVPEPDNDR